MPPEIGGEASRLDRSDHKARGEPVLQVTIAVVVSQIALARASADPIDGRRLGGEWKRLGTG